MLLASELLSLIVCGKLVTIQSTYGFSDHHTNLYVIPAFKSEWTVTIRLPQFGKLVCMHQHFTRLFHFSIGTLYSLSNYVLLGHNDVYYTLYVAYTTHNHSLANHVATYTLLSLLYCLILCFLFSLKRLYFALLMLFFNCFHLISSVNPLIIPSNDTLTVTKDLYKSFTAEDFNSSWTHC